ncbi:hypothetical protein A3J43_02025 [Candidatus Uhrbacteria bacterium RIFCSPHIGHO2_12_FULL_54_23]|uniref:VanZ-like domain-containing protein n=3 Tax=Candidatus Uhriibacteriota TaxID=1752732 RepID=A0A1F7UP13_9BACT|nr:MAG: hypothetical protein A3J43_02025 [Candidatus Uhrbacteria bacterium RIFCSPHIGHO2_12_FULL_54_23]OGL83859.1 MAG: hypothetical protein A3B36_02475 [Candidatus Uhrbacteria bacterium RIFCSPLOWO2_01_FULL_55_36]OGL91081.1 MAG: hypothetical protein A3J36_00880 [Candidatus Uhrbacteria bacterium RIFCSPLOWO2_02_FULL_54_37]
MRHWLPPLLWAVLIFIGSSIPGREIPGMVSTASILLHVGEYCALAALAARAGARQPGGMQGWQIAVVAFAAAVWFAVTDEIHQAWVPGRTVDTMDFIADAAGAGAGTLAWYFLLRSRVWKKRHIIV